MSWLNPFGKNDGDESGKDKDAGSKDKKPEGPDRPPIKPFERPVDSAASTGPGAGEKPPGSPDDKTAGRATSDPGDPAPKDTGDKKDKAAPAAGDGTPPQPPAVNAGKKKRFPIIRTAFLLAAVGAAGVYGADYAGYPKPLEETKKVIGPVADTVGSIFHNAGQIPGPLAESVGLAIQVKPNERAVITYGGNLDGLGYIGEPGYNYVLPWGHELERTYRIDMQSRNINTEEDGVSSVDIATNDNQLILEANLTLQFKQKEDKVGETHTYAQDYEAILKQLALRVSKEVLGDINISNVNAVNEAGSGMSEDETLNVLENITQQNLTALRDEINRRMTQGMRTALIGTTLENRFEIMGLQLTTFKFTDDFTASIEDFSDKKNKIIGEQAILAQKRVIAEQARVQSAGERDAKKNRADGDAYEIRELGNATGDRLAAEVAPLANPGADNLLRLKQYEAWASGGAQVPDVLTMGGGSNGGGGPTMVFDGRNLLPLLDGQQQAPKAPGEEEGALEDGAAADETALVEPAAADAAPPPVKNFGPR